MSKTTVHLGLGTNLGDRWENLHQALELLSAGPGLRFQRCSQIYETEPWGVAEQPRYLNCVAEFATVLEPDPLLALCKRVERQLGRVPGERWGPASSMSTFCSGVPGLLNCRTSKFRIPGFTCGPSPKFPWQNWSRMQFTRCSEHPLAKWQCLPATEKA